MEFNAQTHKGSTNSSQTFDATIKSFHLHRQVPAKNCHTWENNKRQESLNSITNTHTKSIHGGASPHHKIKFTSFSGI